ncbi:MAG: CsbD family protein, partial [Acidimicrobiales bacterium]
MGAADKLKNETQKAAGAAEKAAGKATGDRSLEAEGRADQASADLKQAGEKV